MRFRLRCNNCKNILTYSPESGLHSFIECPVCGQSFYANILAKLDAVSDLADCTLVGVDEGFWDGVFHDDLLFIESFYDASDQSTQEHLFSIIDHLRLLLDSKNEASLRKACELLRDLQFQRFEEKQKAFEALFEERENGQAENAQPE